MTITTTHSFVRSIANGVNTEFPFDFVLLASSDLEVYVGANPANPSDYTVAIDADNGGGTVNFLVPPAGSSIITMKRNMIADQQTKYPEAGPFPPTAHERALDKLTMLIQQIIALNSDAVSAVTWRGSWVGGGAYRERDMIKAPDGGFYVCTFPHTSGVDFSVDLSVGKWIVAIDTAAIINSFASMGSLPAATIGDIGKVLTVGAGPALAYIDILKSAALTDTPTAPTAAPGTNTIQVANTAFVAALGALKANLASFVGLDAPNGQQPFPGGAVVQWGADTYPGGGVSRAVSFPIAFTNFRGVFFNGNVNQLLHRDAAVPPTVNGFSYYGGASAQTVYWFAIGKVTPAA